MKTQINFGTTTDSSLAHTNWCMEEHRRFFHIILLEARVMKKIVGVSIMQDSVRKAHLFSPEDWSYNTTEPLACPSAKCARLLKIIISTEEYAHT